MAYHVQAEIRRKTTIYVGWYECGELLSGKFEEGFTLADLWPGAILEDRTDSLGKNFRGIADDPKAEALRLKLIPLKGTKHAG